MVVCHRSKFRLKERLQLFLFSSDKGLGQKFDFNATTNVALAESGLGYMSRSVGAELGYKS
jgi:hypothetical protein